MPRSAATSTIRRGVTDRAISRSDGRLMDGVLLRRRGALGAGRYVVSALAWAVAARTRWVRRRAFVIGPTPPGTGVIAPATDLALSKSTSPTSAPSTTLIPTSTTTAPGRSIEPVIKPG